MAQARGSTAPEGEDQAMTDITNITDHDTDSLAARVLTSTEHIPPLTNSIPSAFIPFLEDITKQPGAPRDRIERLKRILESIEAQREGVRENLFYMFEREAQRIMMQAKDQESGVGFPTVNPGLPRDEVEWTIMNMEAPAQPGVEYNMPPLPAPDPAAHHNPQGAPSIRDEAVRSLLSLVDAAVAEMRNMENFMAGHKREYEAYLEKEKARVAEASLRPEERPRVAEAPM
ncbi:hypothetical protein QBC46DRAFT_369475 [Diplogelasinospora grovesii]|uniref:Uncharacterized protein n=1 Tax=Diplogelasinospora grovesii TaxID=303347 RepID=A0AAN6NK48_9PEZI|nr:hypothetical protein QBC46DRAFT_369475 [Diplogelasinospora grovesii]